MPFRVIAVILLFITILCAILRNSDETLRGIVNILANEWYAVTDSVS